MDIFLSLSHSNPEHHIQAIPLLAKSGSPYAIDVLKTIAAEARDMKVKDLCKSAAQELRQNIGLNGKIKKHNFDLHIEILMGMAALNADTVATIREAKRSVARAYSFDKTVLDNPDYYEVAERAFQGNVYELEQEVRQFVRQTVKNERNLRGSYPPYMYLVDVPVWIILTLTLASLTNPDFAIRMIRNVTYTWEFIDWNIVQMLAFALVMLVALRLVYIAINQWYRTQVFGWEREARVLAIAHLEGEIAKLVSSSKQTVDSKAKRAG